jgi:adenylate cyclase
VWDWLKNRGVVHCVIVALFVVPMAGLLTIQPNSQQPYASKIRLWFDSLEYSSIDYRIQFGRKAKADPQIVLLYIDAPSISLSALDDQTIAASKPLSSIRSSGTFPFPREVYAAVCDQLFSAGAKVVAFDLMFPNPSPSDPPFEQALDKYHNQVVIGLRFSDDSTSYSLPAASLLASQDPLDDRLGFLNFWQDSDENPVRCAQYRNNLDYVNGHVGAENLPKLYSLAARAVQRAGYANLVPDDLIARPMRFAGPSRFSTYSFYQLFDPDSWKKIFKNGEFFRGKIVVVGPEGSLFKDILPTPMGNLPGVEVHLNAINDLLQNEFLSPASSGLIFATVIASGLAALLLALTIAQIAWRFLAAALVLAGYAAALVWAYNGPGWLLPAVAPIGVFGGATGAGFVYDFVLAQIEKFRLRATFERYYSKNVVKYLLDHTASYKGMLAGARKPVTVLFSDIRGFTTIVETTADSQQLVDKLNEYFTAMVDCVFRYDGTLGKFMGDGIMAVWGDTPYNFGPQEDAVRAVRAALAMLAELRRLNAKWLAEGKTEWHIGIGLNHGQVIVGDMGSQQHKEFGVVGDAINVGSRLEGATKEYRLQILLGERVAELVGDTFHLRSVDFVQVKGKTRSVQAFTVLGEKSEPLPPDQQKFLALYEEGISSFRRREFARAKELFAQALQLQPGDDLAAQYLASSAEFIEHPPDASWTGVRVMTEK